MTPHSDALYLRHMLAALDRVVEATKRVTLDEFSRDWIIQDAIVHELQILGGGGPNLP